MIADVPLLSDAEIRDIVRDVLLGPLVVGAEPAWHPGRRSPAHGGGYIPRAQTDWLFHRPGMAPLKRHAGVDVYVRPDEPVTAPEGGLITDVLPYTTYGEEPGRWKNLGPEAVRMKGDSGVYHLFAHLKGVKVKKNDFVTKAQPIADNVESGTYNHVHWTIGKKALHSGGKEEPYSHVITYDPVAWLQGKLVSFTDATDKIIPKYAMRAKYSVHLPGWKKKKPAPPPTVAVVIPKKDTSALAVLIAVGIGGFFYYAKKRRWF